MTPARTGGRAVLVHAGALGDFVLALRVVAALRSFGPDGITLLGRSPFAELARCAGIERFVDFETGGFHRLYRDDVPLPAPAELQLAGHGCVVDMTGGGDVFQRRLAATTGGRVIPVDPLPRPGATTHITDQWLWDLHAAGLRTDGVGPPRIDLPRGRRQRTVIVHPGSGGRAKCWPLDRFLELAGQIHRDGWDVRFVVGPAELESWPGGELARLAEAGPVLRPDRLIDLAGLLATAGHYVGNDSGVTHLAAAVGTAVTAVFGPTDPGVWRPLGERVTVVRADAWPEVDAVAHTIRERLDAPSATG
jgi:heptosyltransferase-3